MVPLHKKNNTLDKGNYRPVSILPMISKIFERAVNSQIVEFFDSHFHTSLSAFRKGYGCQTALLKVIEDWKKALDQNKYVAAILMDLSKAFGCLPHDLLILKLKTYGASPSVLNVCALLFMHVCPYACFVIYMYVGFKSSSELMLYVLYSDFK